uniref:Fibronectin type-III domain-containing protein n=1 Tax=Mesocestoides corti TaxID=53468 RepID=A0A5K3G5R9_MESCO
INGSRVCSVGVTAFGHTLPSAPLGVILTAVNDSTMKVSWEHPSITTGIAKYTATVKTKEDKSCETTNDVTTCNISSLEPSTEYTVVVKSCDISNGEKQICSTVVEKSDYTKPSAPTGVKVTAKSDTSLEVTWTPASTRTTSYDYSVYIKSSEIHHCGPHTTETSCTITSLSPYTAYSVVARSCFKPTGNDERICDDAEEVSDHTLPSAPVNLRLQAVTSTTVEASWSCLQEDNGPEPFLYTLSTSDGQSCSGSCTSGHVSCTVKNLLGNTPYNLTVKACDRNSPPRCSSPSTELSACTKSKR